MAPRYILAAVLLAALSVPVAAQEVKSDTSKKTVTTSPGIIADTAAPKVTPPSPTVTTPAPAPVTPPADANAAVPTMPNAAPSDALAATGQVQPTSGVVKVQVKVAPSLANTAKISADSAFALARASNTAGEISSAELEMTDRRLVYQVKMVKGAGASTVYVDAMTGEVVKDKKFGGLKAAAENQEESKKLYDAKKESGAATKP